MHASVMRWAAEMVDRHHLADLMVLEAGALNVNGTVRGLFHGPYLATDMRDGPGVDRVVNAHQLFRVVEPSLARYEVVVCTEMLEHDDHPFLSCEQMRACVYNDGWLLLTCRGYDERGCFGLHDYPDDLWRFSVEGVRRMLLQTGWRPITVEADPECPGVFALARAS